MNPEIKKDPFILEEDILLLETRLSLGNKWSEIRKRLPGRTENNVKNSLIIATCFILII